MDLKRMLQEKKFYLAVVIAFLGIIAGTAYPEETKNSLPAGTFIKLVIDGLKSQTVRFILPIASVLPMGEEYLRDRQGSFLRFLVTRRTKQQYCRDKVLTTALSGAVVWMAAAILSLLFFFLLFFAREELFSYSKQYVLELLLVLGRVCLTGSILAALSAVCALFGNSVYHAFGIPFLSFYACIIMRERYLEDLYCIDPKEWICAEHDWGGAQQGLWIFLLLLMIGFSAFHHMLLMQKLEEV